MEKSYRLNGLDCANCAAKIETNIQKIAGVQTAQVDFMTTKLTIEAENNDLNRVCQEAKAIVKKIEPEVVVENWQRNEATENDQKLVLLRIFSSLLLLVGLHFLNLTGLFALLAYSLLFLWIGFDVLKTALGNMFHGEVFDENFLMALATLGALAIGEYPEAVAVMLFYQIGEFFQSYAVGKSRKSITSLLANRPDSANLLVAGKMQRVHPETVKIGDLIVVNPGEKIPLDGKIVKGESLVDTSALTGESVPRPVVAGENILSGFVNQTGQLRIEVTTIFSQSTVSKILDLVENASSKKAPAENFITKFARYYTPIVVICAVLLAVVPPLVTGAAFYDWLYRALTFLVISCPCALVISVPLSFFGGIGGASKAGILIKGSNYIEALAKTDIFVFDKTGTLTQGVFAVQKVETEMEQEKFLQLAASLEQSSSHPIGQSILKFYGGTLLPVEDLQEVAGYGISGKIEGQQVLVGNQKWLEKNQLAFTPVQEVGTIIYLAIDQKFAGYLVIADQLKKQVPETITALKKLGVKKTVMLTGDNQEIAIAIAEKIGIDQVYSELLPAEKVAHLEKLLTPENKVTFVGDGMNDAPVLARADLGIAMGGLGSDAAIEAADVVIMDDEPLKIPKALKISRKTMKIVKENIVFAIGIKLFVLLLGALGFASMAAAVFADVGVTVLAVLNAMRCLRVK